jgi:hypothetical protein
MPPRRRPLCDVNQEAPHLEIVMMNLHLHLHHSTMEYTQPGPSSWLTPLGTLPKRWHKFHDPTCELKITNAHSMTFLATTSNHFEGIEGLM